MLVRLKCPRCSAEVLASGPGPHACPSCGFTSAQIHGGAPPSGGPPAGAFPAGMPGTPTPASTPAGTATGGPHSAWVNATALPVDQRPMDPFAVGGFAAAALSIFLGVTTAFLLPLIAIGLSIAGLHRTGPHGAYKGHGFALAGLIIGIGGLLLSAMFAILAAIFGVFAAFFGSWAGWWFWWG